MPAAEILVNLVVNVLVDETNRAVGKSEIGAAGVFGMKTPGDVPVPHAVRRSARAEGPVGWFGTLGCIVGGAVHRHWVDGPVDGLNGLSLRDIVAGDPPVGGVALEFG